MPGNVLGAKNVEMTKTEKELDSGNENQVGETDLEHITVQMIMLLQLGKTLFKKKRKAELLDHVIEKPYHVSSQFKKSTQGNNGVWGGWK